MAIPAGDAGGAASSANQVSPSRAAPAADLHKCSVCACCCSAGAILNPLPHMPEPEIATTVLGLWCKAVASVILANKMTLTLRFAVK